MWGGVWKKKIKSGKSIKINCHHHYYHRYIYYREEGKRELTKLHGWGWGARIYVYKWEIVEFLHIVLRYQQNEILYCDSLASHMGIYIDFFSQQFFGVIVVTVLRFFKTFYQEKFIVKNSRGVSIFKNYFWVNS